MRSDSSSNLSPLLLTSYFATLLLLFLGSFLPEQRCWGLNVWGFLPDASRYVLLTAGIAVGIIVTRFGTPVRGSKAGSGLWYWSAFAVLIISGVLFYLLRARTYFLGDGWIQLAWLRADYQYSKGREFGAELLLVGLKKILTGSLDPGLLAYQLTAVSAGLLYVAVALTAMHREFKDYAMRLAGSLVLLSSGCVLLFFGYVENYALFILSVLIYVVVGKGIAERRISIWWLIPVTVVPSALHIFGTALLPASIYLIIARTQVGAMLGQIRRTYLWSVAVILALAAGIYAVQIYRQNLFLQLAILPIFRTRFTQDGYTLFSLPHLVDYLNLVFLLLPGFLVGAGSSSRPIIKKALKSTTGKFLLILVGSAVAATFLPEPKLGMPRDWDVLCFVGVPMAVLALLFIGQADVKHRPRIALLVSALGLLVLIPRACLLASPEFGMNQMKSYGQLDPVRNRTGMGNLVSYAKEHGNPEQYSEIQTLYAGLYPEESLLLKAKSARRAGNLELAKQLCYTALEVSPQFSFVWFTLGEIYIQQGNLDSALICNRIADGINPNNADILNNLAFVQAQKGQVELAREGLLKAAKIDPQSTDALYNLYRLEISAGDSTSAERFLSEGASRAKSSPQLLK